MPVKTCSFDALETTITELEQSGARLISVAPANEDTVLIAYFTPERKLPKGRETR